MYVINIEINEAKMNLMLVEIIDKIRFETRPKKSRVRLNQSGTTLLRIS
jgi:hypothetical protein